FFINSRVSISFLKRLDLLLMPIDEEQSKSFIKIDKKGTRIKPLKQIRKDILENLIGCSCQIKKINSIQGFIAYRQIGKRLISYGIVLTYPQKRNPKRVILLTTKRLKHLQSSYYNKVIEIVNPELKPEKQEMLASELHTFLQRHKAGTLV
ncbi:MAG: hypothetical protein ACK4S0_15230, partial [Sediminibacterium sp.]